MEIIHLDSYGNEVASSLFVKFKKLVENAQCPTQAKIFDAGYDLYAVDSHDLLPGQRALVKTGISVAIPEGYYGRIAPRSGLAWKNGIDVLAGVVDATYRGEIGVVLINLSNDQRDVLNIRPGMRVAQLIIEKCHSVQWHEVKELPSSDRSTGGFGSTGA